MPVPMMGTYEAETASLTGGANKNTNHAGYTGTGFVDGYQSNTSAKASYTVIAAAGSYEVKLHYSAGNGTSANTGLYVNNTKIKNITFPGTGSWDKWADEQETVTLNPGANTIAYKAETPTSTTICINLDYITITP